MKSFKIDIYEVKIDVVVKNDFKESDEYIKKFNKKYKTEYTGDAIEGCVLVANSKHFCVIFIKQYIGYNVIAHESYHLTEMIADNIGLSKKGNKEGRAYLNGFINEKISNILKNR